jgi:hypothetical protein
LPNVIVIADSTARIEALLDWMVEQVRSQHRQDGRPIVGNLRKCDDEQSCQDGETGSFRGSGQETGNRSWCAHVYIRRPEMERDNRDLETESNDDQHHQSQRNTSG